jgi:hypothetical protein
VVQDCAVDVCNDKLILALTIPFVNYANNTIDLSPHSQFLDDRLPPQSPPEPPDLMFNTDADPDPDIFTLWCNRVSTLYCSGDLLCTLDVHPCSADLLCTLDVYPPGSLFDPNSQLQYGNLNGFPYLRLKVISMDNTTSPTSRFGNVLLSLQQDAILPLCFNAMVDLQQLGPLSLADGSSNLCLMNDPTLLVDVVDIDPFLLRWLLQDLRLLHLCAHRRGTCPFPFLMEHYTTSLF